MVKLILVKGNTFVSRLIKKITCSEYSHVGFLFGTTTVEADYGGVQVRDIASYPWPYDVYEIAGMTWDKHYALHKSCLTQIGKPYDYGKVIGLLFELVFHYSGVRSLMDSKNAFICSEFVVEQLRELGMEFKVTTLATPASIALDPQFSKLAARSYKP